ncbi:glycerol-3-phosphate 1-O-acyltransferase PlsY [uncultured Cohaesibacter sp.]|uniref:glycerol-3-phosphate 1-O-acyltransferase PlsY n=1 Tax=uncultured Cohaesibacter sp. TaxID=1002546 RepID=UPI00292DD8FE|nr:glycerol-3-phosphate 1-O-acyltransferase PlsY [uncultured Cohaesibacter sp.]
MNVWIAMATAASAAYLLGSIPAGFLAGKLLQGIDIREHGSGSTGATNVLRTLGKGPALAVFLFDVGKGVAAILLARWLCQWLLGGETGAVQGAANDPDQWASWIIALAGLMVIVGHSRSLWLNFTGGKSIATGLGMLLAISWPVGLSGLAVFIIVLAIVRIVSLSSILAALTVMIVATLLALPLAYLILVYLGALYVIWRHKANVKRLLAGTEPRVGQKSSDQKNPGQKNPN